MRFGDEKLEITIARSMWRERKRRREGEKGRRRRKRKVDETRGKEG